ncbi:MAG TPA: Hsp20/alpha crystallin family protein [Jiangellaceae bacterium]|jgi:HSP20 family protein|nr:Hsp20/alpha crystallin family protein [Jiangellaceae bacterium]
MLMRTDPFRELDRLTQQLLRPSNGVLVMPMDAYRQDNMFYIKFDLPGIDADSVDVTVEQNVLTVQARRPALEGVDLTVAERPTGSFSRQIFLGDTLDVEKLEADYSDGVLTIQIPVMEAAQPRKIQIAHSGERREITGS